MNWFTASQVAEKLRSKGWRINMGHPNPCWSCKDEQRPDCPTRTFEGWAPNKNPMDPPDVFTTLADVPDINGTISPQEAQHDEDQTSRPPRLLAATTQTKAQLQRLRADTDMPGTQGQDVRPPQKHDVGGQQHQSARPGNDGTPSGQDQPPELVAQRHDAAAAIHHLRSASRNLKQCVHRHKGSCGTCQTKIKNYVDAATSHLSNGHCSLNLCDARWA